MKPRHLAIEGFRSFKKDVVFDFATKAGFYLMTGENRVNPELGANGVGKSSIWDAMCWVMYGKTARGLRGSVVANWDKNDLTSVLFEFKQNGIVSSITRTHDPNSLTLTNLDPHDEEREGNPQVATQEELDALLGMDYTTFLHTVLMGQFNRFFFDLTATEKLAVFAEALRLDYWTACSDKARAEAASLEEKLHSYEVKIAEMHGVVAAMEQRIPYEQDRSEKFEADRKKTRRRLRKGLEEAKDEVQKYRSEVEAAIEERRAWKREFKRAHHKLIKLDKRQREIEKELRDAQEVLRASEWAEAGHAAHQKKLQELDGECPVCLQKLKDKQIDSAVEYIDKLRQWEEGEVGRAGDDIAKWKKAHKRMAKKILKASLRLDEAEDSLSLAKGQERAVQGRKSAAKAKLGDLASQLKAAKTEVNLHQQRVTVDTKMKADAEEAAEHIAKQLKGDQQARSEAIYWAKAFKELRLWLIEEALVELEVEVNNSLIQLGLEDWSVKFDVERENAKGGVTKGFTVSISNAETVGHVPWEAWCGGETQRLRIAGAIGLSNLICGRLGVKPRIEVWDEPTAHLSEEGIADLLAFFSARARTENKQIWIVDHRSLNFGGFDGQVLVVKEDLGSRIAGKEV